MKSSNRRSSINRGRAFGWRDPARMRCGTFAKTHGREAESYLMSGNGHLNYRCDFDQARAMLRHAKDHRKWMMKKAQECLKLGKSVDMDTIRQMNRRIQNGIRALAARLRRPCTPKYPYVPMSPPPVPSSTRRSSAA